MIPARMMSEDKPQVKNKDVIKTTDLSKSSNDEKKVTANVNFVETREIAERILSVFVWNGH